jgi:hypothetical protein
MCFSLRVITARLSPKTLTPVGWVEERNPTFGWLCWVSQSLNPTIFLNRAVLAYVLLLTILKYKSSKDDLRY